MLEQHDANNHELWVLSVLARHRRDESEIDMCVHGLREREREVERRRIVLLQEQVYVL